MSAEECTPCRLQVDWWIVRRSRRQPSRRKLPPQISREDGDAGVQPITSDRTPTRAAQRQRSSLDSQRLLPLRSFRRRRGHQLRRSTPDRVPELLLPHAPPTVL
ncbi:unnamed protein product [Echinostoma caproni]|uniref:Uncharacterized protein n=1 Tax=Echinostoma caproni TaxID=27848 RepID=A0A183AUT3_9TREM|nr:unnamed protein product [Echinostoma caproni]